MAQSIIQQEEIFMRALEIEDSSKREEFLSRVCMNEPELHQKIDRMLRLHDRKDNVLDCTSDGLFQRPAFENDPLPEGTQVGPYKLLQQVGAGGMGVVYMAQQTDPVRRNVAVKIIKQGVDSRNVIARFESERQALAMMNHPNITKFLDAGITESGSPYFVMELITGLPVTQYADERRLSPKQRMALFASVCSAIRHAHQKGVIHRDIKPSNIMVTELDGQPVPKVIDFGIAKAINDPLTQNTMFTSYGKIIGTPEYMSPEQAEMNGLDVDTSSDVYSLGVLLYELMTGRTPLVEHKGSGLLKFCDAICHVEPSLASTCANHLNETQAEIAKNRGTDKRSLRQFLKGDVDWILAKCLAKRPQERYATAAALADDVDRYLVGKPVEAAAPSARYRVKKFLVRNRFTVSIAAILTSSLFVATIVSLVFAFRASHAEQLAQIHLQQSRESQKVAESERDRARNAEARIRELERQSRLEASSAQAVVRYRNQEEQRAVQDLSSADAVDAAESKELSLQIVVASNGNITMSSEDNQFSFEFAIRSQGSPLAKSTRLRIKELKPSERKHAHQVLRLVTEELRKRFGQLDLFVAEPKLSLAELEMDDGNWKSAERQVRQIAVLFVNNYSHRELRAKNQLLLATILAKQDLQSKEAIKLLKRYRKSLSKYEWDPSLDAALQSVFQALDVANSQNRELQLSQGLTELVGLREVVLSSVFESMEWELKKREDSIKQR